MLWADNDQATIFNALNVLSILKFHFYVKINS